MSGVVDLDPTATFEAGTPVTVHPATWGTAQPNLSDEQRHLWPGGGYLGSASTWPHTAGALAEQLVVRRDQVRRLPTSLPVKRAALAEPLAVGLHALAVAGGIRVPPLVVVVPAIVPMLPGLSIYRGLSLLADGGNGLLSLITAAGAAPATSSSGRKKRPTCGVNPSAPGNPDETISVDSCSARRPTAATTGRG